MKEYIKTLKQLICYLELEELLPLRRFPIVVLCLQLIIIQLQSQNAFVLNPVGSEVEINWNFVIEPSGGTKVYLTVTNINQSEISFDIPKTCQDLRITPMLNNTIRPLSGYSYDELRIQCENVDQFNLSYVWLDGAIQYEGTFYFAGQEKPYVDLGTITIRLPKNCSVLWFEGYNDFTGNVTDELTFKVDMAQPIPSFSYSFPDVPQPEIASRISEHVTLHYHPTMEGKPWVKKTIEIVEEQWSWLKTTLNGTLNHVDITFAPYGYNDLGTKKGGLCYHNSRNIEILATRQFGIGLIGQDTAVVFHELAHAFTPLLEVLPSFYSEAIAEDFAYDVLRRTELNASADSCEEMRFYNAYEYGVKQGLFDYIWLWNWDDTIYDNRNITWACYGIVAFIGDYITHHWGCAFYENLNDIFNKTEIRDLYGDQKLAKFIEYMSEACSCNMTRILNTLSYLVTRWFDAYNFRNEYRGYKVEITGPFTKSAQPTIDEMILNATNEYSDRNYEAAIQKFKQIRGYIETLRSRDISYWREARFWKNIAILEVIVFATIVLLIVVSYRRKLQRFKTLS